MSGAHFNPVVSAADWWLGRRTRTGLTALEPGGYVAAQALGAVDGCALANTMYAVTPVTWSTTTRSAGRPWLGETVATAGLILLVLALARSGRNGRAVPHGGRRAPLGRSASHHPARPERVMTQRTDPVEAIVSALPGGTGGGR